MALEIKISSEVEEKLRQRAAVVGEDIAAYAAGVLERFVEHPETIEQISGSIAEEFRQSGMSEDELAELLEAAKHDMRRQRRRP